jgi:hypothetical protein
MTCVLLNVYMTLYTVLSGANDSNDNTGIAGTNGDSSSSSSDNSSSNYAVTLQDLKLAIVDLKQQALQLEQASTSSKDFESGNVAIIHVFVVHCIYL